MADDDLTETAQTRMSKAQLAEVKEHAKQRGLSFAAFLRYAALYVARKEASE